MSPDWDHWTPRLDRLEIGQLKTRRGPIQTKTLTIGYTATMVRPGEIEHAKVIFDRGEDVWHWGTNAGRQRAQRRAKMLIEAAGIGSQSRVLELGCGTGIFTSLLAQTGSDIVAVDISPVLLDQAVAKPIVKPIEWRVTFRIEDAERMTFEDASFDVVVGSSILHHLDVEQAIGEIYRVLRAGGRMAFGEPNMMNPQIVVERSTPAIRRRMGVSPKETAFFRWKLSSLLCDAGFSDVCVKPHDFLHPAVPGPLVPFVQRVGAILERVPLVREIAGSLLISARRP